MKRYIYFLLLFFSIVFSCKKPYNPPASSSPGSFLVVEGVISSGSDSTIIKLSRTVNLATQVVANPELGAVLIIESNQNNIYPLIETGNGNYAAVGLNLDNTLQYRLRIKTSANQQYLSAFVPLIVTPPIDSVAFNLTSIQGAGLQVYVNTHDPKNNTHYYRWDYTETWQFHAEYYTSYISNGVGIVPRTPAQLIYTCFTNDNSSNILIGSSAKLKQDVIYQAPLVTIASTAEKIETEYSILVHEYALTSDAYNFYTNLKTNTENLGSIFDAQPSQLVGNIHNINNAAEPVIGYISASTVQTKRIFISRNQLPSSWTTVYPYSCGLDSNFFSNKYGMNEVAFNLVPLPNSDVPTQAFYQGGPGPAGYLSSGTDCVDCTIRGTTVKPGFWPY